MKVATRIELAATLLAQACEAAFEGAEATGDPEYVPTMFALTEDVVLRRARELYADRSSD